MTNAVAIQGPRLPYHPGIAERFPGVDQGAWRVLTDAVFPAAEKPESIIMALAYCRARNLDIFKKPVQIVPIYDKKRGGMVDTVWPGIAELRTTAMRTGSFAGFEDTEYGPMIDEKLGGVDMRYPEWAQCTVYRLVGGHKVAFVGPKVFWMETYATAGRDTKKPNAMWLKRPRGQVEKCAEAAALRRAFPEEIGNEYAAEEIEGQAFGSVRDVTPKAGPGLAARLAAPVEPDSPAEGFTVHNTTESLGDDEIPGFEAEVETPPVDDFPGDREPAGEGSAAGRAEANADEDPGAADDHLTPKAVAADWHAAVTAALPSMSADEITAFLTKPDEQAAFARLEEHQPQLAMDLNKAITARRKDLT